jgi:N-acetylglucosaminyl-diphospho-decaprenol L-rhamnosyltransferase
VSESDPQLSVIVVTHNSLPRLSECLEALSAASKSVRAELILVDNASRDGSPEEAVLRLPQATVIRNEKNVGFATACNQGADVAGSEYLLFLNPDVVIDPNAISSLMSVLENRPKAGLVSGRLRFPDGRFQATCRQAPTIANMIFSRRSLMYRLFGRTVEKGKVYTLPDYNETTEVPVVAATMVAVERERFEKIGGFDRRFFMYMEDTDLSVRFNLAGYTNYFVPSAGGVHRWGEGSRAGRVTRLWRHHLSVWKYFLKHYPNGFSVIFLPAFLAINFTLTALFSRGGKGEAN